MTKVEWTHPPGYKGESWNPIRGCSHESPGCTNCYAAAIAYRFGGPGEPFEDLTRMTPHGPRWTGEVRLLPDRLDLPLRWRSPRAIFTASVSDPFHAAVPFDYAAAMLGIMALTPQHIHIPLTKRPDRAVEFFAWLDQMAERVIDTFPDESLNWRRWHVLRAAAIRFIGTGLLPNIPSEDPPWPLPNAWFGISVENQEAANGRLAAARAIAEEGWLTWVSHEPALGQVDWTPWMAFLSWLVSGGESGPHARPMHPDWARSDRDQCQAAGVPLFFKSWGEYLPEDQIPAPLDNPWGGEAGHASGQYGTWAKVGKKAAGHLLDGLEWRQWPEVAGKGATV